MKQAIKILDMTEDDIKKTDPTSIYKMKLHDTLWIDGDLFATRVPGGWIYEIIKPQANVLETVFVPFNNEFQ